MHENYGQIGRNITQLLNEKGKTQFWLSQQTGINVSSVCKYTKGQIVPSLYNAVRLCNALDITMNDLVEGWINE